VVIEALFALSFLFSFYLLYLFFSCLLPINLVNTVDYNDVSTVKY